MAKILCVDDHPIALNAIMDYLSSHGHEVIGAKSGMEGLKALTQDIDIITLDYRMPVLNGHEFSRIIKTDSKFSAYNRIPLIGVGDFPEDEREFLDDFVNKTSTEELIPRIAKYCNHQ